MNADAEALRRQDRDQRDTRGKDGQKEEGWNRNEKEKLAIVTVTRDVLFRKNQINTCHPFFVQAYSVYTVILLCILYKTVTLGLKVRFHIESYNNLYFMI